MIEAAGAGRTRSLGEDKALHEVCAWNPSMLLQSFSLPLCRMLIQMSLFVSLPFRLINNLPIPRTPSLYLSQLVPALAPSYFQVSWHIVLSSGTAGHCQRSFYLPFRRIRRDQGCRLRTAVIVETMFHETKQPHKFQIAFGQFQRFLIYQRPAAS